MRGLRIDWESTENRRLMSRFEERMSVQLAPGSNAELREALHPAFASAFSRLFGPIFPEIFQRNWLICESCMSLEEPEFFEKDETSRAVSGLNAQILDEGDWWLLVTGEFLVRTSNHLSENETTMQGIPNSRWRSFDKDRQGVVDREELKGIAADYCDIAFDEYEGIWGAFFDDPRLLARTFYHCSELADVSEVIEGVGLDGDWLTRIRFSCPNLPVLLATESRDD